MTTIDDKIVYISLNTKDFEEGTKSVLKSIDDLKAGMQFKDAGKGLSELNKHVNAFSLAGIGENIQHIASHFSALGAIGFSVLNTLTNGALHFGKAMVEKVLSPIIEGGKQRALNIENAKFQFRALGQNVDKMMASSLAAVKGTAYGLDEAAKAAGQFGAAGINAGSQMTSTLRGVAGIAAVTNSSFSDISQIFTTMAGTGKINSEQLYQFATRGLNVAAALAKQWNTTETHVRQLASQGKISFKQFAGAMDDAFGAHAKEANQTFTGAMKNMQAALARIGADFWTPLLKSQRNVFNALTPFFDKVHEAIMPLIDLFGKTSLANSGRFVKMINSIDLTGLAKGMPDLAAGIKNILTLIRTLVTPLKDAFRDIFPPTLASSFVNFTKEFKKFTATLKPSPATLENLRHTFAGLFAILDIGKQILTGILTTFGRMFGVVAKGSGGLLEFTGKIGDFFVSIDKALKKGDRLKHFFEDLSKIIAVPMGVIGQIRVAIVNLFGAFDPQMATTNIIKLASAFTPFQKIILITKRAWDVLMAHLKGTDFSKVTLAINNQIAGLGDAINKAISNMNFDSILLAIRTGLFGGLVLMFKQFLGRGSLVKQLSGAGGGIIGNISKSFSLLTGSMKAMQQNIKAKTLKEIAIAVGLLTASVVALSFVDPQKLQGALAAMTIGFSELVGTMYALNKITSTSGAAKLAIVSTALITLAFALDLLSLAVIALSQLSWQELVKGLGGVAGMLGILIVAIKPLTANSKGLIGTGIGLIAVATGLRIMANAVAAFGGMNLETLGKGLGSVAIGLGILALGMRAMPKGMIAQSAALLGIAIALRVLANVVQKLGGMSLNTIGKGMLGIAGALVIIAGAMHIMPKGMLVQAAALFIVANAIGKIADAVMAMGGMSIGQIAKGLITLAASLAILAAGLYVMEGAIAGAAALAVAAVGVSLMATALTKLGKMSWMAVIRGLIALAAVFVIIGAAGMLLTPVIPTLLGFGAALILVGAGLALAGAGIFLVAAGLSLFVVALTSALGILEQGVVQFVQGVVNLAKGLALGILEIVKGIAATAPQLVAALITILNSLLDGIIQIAPKVAEAIMALIDAIVKIIGANDDKIVAAGMGLIIALLQGIGDHIGEVVKTAANIVFQFVNAIVANMNKVIALGIQIVVSLYSGIITNYSKIITAGMSIVTKFVGAIANNIGKVITAGASIITKLISGIGKAVGGIATAGVQAVTHFATGMGKAAPQLIAAATNMIIKIMNALSKNSVRLADAGAKAVIDFLNGMAKVLRTREPELMAAGFNIGVAIIQGMLNGLTQKGTELLNKAKSIGDGVVKLMKRATGSKSPSVYTHEIGMNLIQGLMNGMDSHSDKLYSAAEDVSNGLIDTFKDVFQITSPSKVMQELGAFVGQGFAKGLRGSGDDIKKAFADLNKQLTDAMATARETISSEEKKLAEERKATKPDAAAIRAAQKTIKENQAILERSRAAHTTLIKSLQDEKKTLLGLAKGYDDVTTKLKDARDALAQATSTRDDAIKGFGDKYATLPDVVTTDAEGHAIDQLATYEEALAHQAAAVGAYHSTLDQLRKLGLDDATYQKLLDEGTADQQFADQLLSGGKTAVDGLNKLDSDLQNVSKTLATNAGNNLYQAGVDAAQGLVSGLTSQAATIQKTMDRIATGMVKALKKKLKIKSPSQAFAEIGQFSMEGMAQGFTDSSKLVTDSIEGVSDDALAAMQKSMQGISEIVTSELDLNPTISPVLDLTQVRSQSEELAALTAPSPITPAASTVQASAISAAQTTAQADQTNIAPGGTSVKFEQNNYSPEALTEIEIYRQTKNQLSQIKSVLALT